MIPPDRYEIFSYIAEARSISLGGGANGIVDEQINLQTMNFGTNHSAQFTDNIMLRAVYWKGLMEKMKYKTSRDDVK